MDWKEYGRNLGLSVDGPMGNYYQKQIEETMANEQRRQQTLGNQPGFQSGYNLQGGNDQGALQRATNQAAGRTYQGAYDNPSSVNDQLRPLGQQTMANHQANLNPYMPSEPTMYAGGSKNFGQAGNQSAGPQVGQAAQGQPFSQNPYMQPMFDSIMQQNTQNLQRNVLPNIGRGGSAAGGYGDTRQAIAEGIAMGDMANANTNAMANIGFQGYQFDKNYGLQNDALNLNVYNANQNWMNQGQQNQLNALDKLLGWNQTYGVGNATNTQNTPMNYWQQFSNTASQLGGMGGTNSQNMQGNPWLGALGGYLTGSQLFGGKP